MAYPYQKLDRPHLHYPGNVSLVPNLFPNQPNGGMAGGYGPGSSASGGHYPGQYGPDYGRLALSSSLSGGYGPGSSASGGHYPGQYGPDYGRLALSSSLSGMGQLGADTSKLVKWAAGALVLWLGYKAYKG